MKPTTSPPTNRRRESKTSQARVHDAGTASEEPKLPLSSEARSTVEEKEEEDPAVTIAGGSADQAAAATEEAQLGN